MRRLVKALCVLCVGMLTVASLAPAAAWATETDTMKQEVGGAEATGEQDSGHPRLSVKSYEIVKGVFERSAECTLRIHIENIDENHTAVVGTVVMRSSNVYPVFGKTNQIHFGEVEPGESISVDFDVNLDRIVTGPNPIELVLDWTDEDTVRYSSTVQISPALLEKIGFEVTTIKMPETVYVSKNATVSISYENTGVENLQNVYLILEGDIEQGAQVVELEDIPANGKDMVDYSLDLRNAGENRISISFKYEDRNGTESRTETVEKLVMVTESNYVVPVPQKKNVKDLLEEYKFFVVCAAVAVLLCIPFLIGLIKRGGKAR